MFCLKKAPHGFLASLVAWTVKRLPTMRETRVRSLGREGPLEKEMATHSRIHAWRIPWTEGSRGSHRVGHYENVALPLGN